MVESKVDECKTSIPQSDIKGSVAIEKYKRPNRAMDIVSNREKSSRLGNNISNLICYVKYVNGDIDIGDRSLNVDFSDLPTLGDYKISRPIREWDNVMGALPKKGNALIRKGVPQESSITYDELRDEKIEYNTLTQLL